MRAAIVFVWVSVKLGMVLMSNDSNGQVEVGKIYEGKVAKIVDFGAFVTILPGKDGLVHISEISSDKNIRINKVTDELSEGDQVKVKVLEVDEGRNRIRLSIREARDGSNE